MTTEPEKFIINIPNRLWGYDAKYFPADTIGDPLIIEQRSIDQIILNWLAEQGLTCNVIKWNDRPQPFMRFEDAAHAIIFKLTFGS
jgi:hypothetical protein